MKALSDYKFDISKYKFYTSSTLFPLDFSLLQKRKCPICYEKLYEMKNKPFFYCKNKQHKQFIISKLKMK